MKQQHKAMFIALRDGKFDAIADGGADASQATRAIVVDSPPSAPPPPPGPLEVSAPTTVLIPAPAAVPGGPRRAATLPHALATAQPLPLPAPTAAQVSRASAPTPPAPGAYDDDGPPTIRQPESELTLDIDALERATAAQIGSPGLRQASELPPPPANLFRDRGGIGKYRMTPVPPAVAAAPAAGPARAATPPPVPRPGAKPSTAPAVPPIRGGSSAPGPAAGERRYAPTRPAAIFGQTRPQPNKSVFGEDLISDKSLDEVILSYLAEDLDEKKKK
jgi:hypothetical protein